MHLDLTDLRLFLLVAEAGSITGGAAHAGLALASASARVRGFAVGRSIFAHAAEQWFGGKWSDARVTEEVAARYQETIRLWQGAATKHREIA